jgi:branched-subunit amino acid ABC-type transport system permease component
MNSLLDADLLQLTANGVVRGLSYAALGAGLALVIGVTTRFHFAYALTYTIAPYVAFWALTNAGVPFWPACLLGVAAAVALSVLIEVGVYAPVAARAGQRSMLAVLVTSIGLSTAGVALIQLWMGTGSVPFYDPSAVPTYYDVAGVQTSSFEIYEAATALVLILGLALFLARTGLGRSVKAVRSNPGLAGTLGISVPRVNVVCFAIAGLVSGACAIWYGAINTVQPTMGDTAVIYGFVIAFLAGTRTSPLRAIPVGLAVALLEQYSSIWLSLQWTQTTAFVVLAVYLAVLAGKDLWPRVGLRRTRLQGA